MTMKLRNVPFSPPDMTEAEANEVHDAIMSGWITTGPRTKKLEKNISEYVGTEKTVCLNSATAAMEMVLPCTWCGSWRRSDHACIHIYSKCFGCRPCGSQL